MNLDVGWTPTTLDEAHGLDERLAEGPRQGVRPDYIGVGGCGDASR